MSYSFGKNIKYTVFGQSHSNGIGCVIDGLPAGEKIDFDALSAFTARRAPGKDAFSTPRKEGDLPEIISGIVDDCTVGAPVCAVIKNTDTHSSDYDKLKNQPRPGHADYTGAVKFGGMNDPRGGGSFSGRMTAPLCFAGGILAQLLKKRGVEIGAHIYSVSNIEDEKINPVTGDMGKLKASAEKPFPTINDLQGEKMQTAIIEAGKNGNSVGGIIECVITGVPAGIGDPSFDGIENKISSAVFAIPAVKGIEFGVGFESAKLTGSENNDIFYKDGEKVLTKTNNHGGILGGISSGMPIIFRVAFKPTPSIGLTQTTLNMLTGEVEPLNIGGRHDPCIVKRAVPAVESAAALAIADFMLG